MYGWPYLIHPGDLVAKNELEVFVGFFKEGFFSKRVFKKDSSYISLDIYLLNFLKKYTILANFKDEARFLKHSEKFMGLKRRLYLWE